MVMISLSASPACGPRFLAGWASWFSSRACQCGLKAWQKSSNWQKSSTSRSNIDTSPSLIVPTQEEECRGDKGLASPQTRNSGYWSVVENRRVCGGRTVQRHVLDLGEINDSQRAAWCQTIEAFDEGGQTGKQIALFPEDRAPPALDCDVVHVRLSGLRLRRPR